MTEAICQACREAVKTLDYLLRNHPAEMAEELSDAVGCVVALRDSMIDHRHRAGQTAERDARLQKVNAAISAIVAGEFPLMGVRWKRIEAARDLLKAILAEEEAEAAPASR
jgi:hypothetical protein